MADLGHLKPYAGSTQRLVIALDIGTTHSGISYCILTLNEVPKVFSVTRCALRIEVVEEHGRAHTTLDTPVKSMQQARQRSLPFYCTTLKGTSARSVRRRSSRRPLKKLRMRDGSKSKCEYPASVARLDERRNSYLYSSPGSNSGGLHPSSRQTSERHTSHLFQLRRPQSKSSATCSPTFTRAPRSSSRRHTHPSIHLERGPICVRVCHSSSRTQILGIPRNKRI